jgi:hypothetical protein
MYIAVWSEPCDRLFADPVAVERLQVVDNPAVTSQMAQDVSLPTMVNDDGEGGAEKTALLLPMAAFLMVNLERRSLDRYRSPGQLPKMCKR